jgi:hypothetical protein
MTKSLELVISCVGRLLFWIFHDVYTEERRSANISIKGRKRIFKIILRKFFSFLELTKMNHHYLLQIFLTFLLIFSLTSGRSLSYDELNSDEYEGKSETF